MAARAEKLTDLAEALAAQTGGVIAHTSIRVPGDLWDAVNACARALDMSANAVVTAALIDFVSAESHRAEVDRFFDEGKDRFHALLDKLSP